MSFYLNWGNRTSSSQEPKDIDVTGSMLKLMEQGLITRGEFDEMMSVLQGKGEEQIRIEIAGRPMEPAAPQPHR
jgi:hypothetical protein